LPGAAPAMCRRSQYAGDSPVRRHRSPPYEARAVARLAVVRSRSPQQS